MILGSRWSYWATPMVLLPVVCRHVSMLKQGMADALMGSHPGRAAPDVEMVPVLLGNGGRVDVGIHEAIRWISGQCHNAPEVCHKHAVGSFP